LEPSAYVRIGLKALASITTTTFDPKYKDASDGHAAMVKEVKFLRKQADKAERMAQSASEPEITRNYLSMARGFRTQAEILKAKKESKKKRRSLSDQ
jgi:hypothetical protein